MKVYSHLPMHRTGKWPALACLMIAAMTGCESTKSVSVDNPVAQDPPPRVSWEQAQADTRQYADLRPQQQTSSPILQTNATQSEVSSREGEVLLTDVVATVNGAPIFAADILEPYGKGLQTLDDRLKAAVNAGQASEEQARQIKNQQVRELLKRDLDNKIEQVLLAESFKSDLSNEQKEQLEVAIDSGFGPVVQKLMAEKQCTTAHELNLKLREEGTSLQALRTAFAQQQMAFQYLAHNTTEQTQVGRKELLDYYNEHIEDYRITGEAKWEEIIIKFGPQRTEAEAAQQMARAIEEIKAGQEFAVVAKNYSEGASAFDGGAWDWTRQGSLASEVIDKALFRLPVGQLSPVLKNKDSYQIVRVTERNDPGMKSFEDVQDEIRSLIPNQSRDERVKEFLDEKRETALITTMFDEQE